MNKLDHLRAEVLTAYAELLTEFDEELTADRKDMVARSRERMTAERYHVVVCGEFRRGKSSLLNALVNRPRLFPVDVDVTTAVVSTLEWGERERAVVYYAEDPKNPAGTPMPREIPLDEVPQYVTEQRNPGNRRMVERIAMCAPVDGLRSGLVLVDTPGVGSINPAHTAATRAYLPNADAILFVGSAVEPLGTVELEFLKQALTHCPIVVTAITMIDRVFGDPGAVVAEARTRVSAVAGVPGRDLVIVPVSAFRKADALDEDDPELLADSGFPELEAALWDGLAATCGAAQLLIALDALTTALEEAYAPPANEIAALRDAGAFEALEAQLRDAREHARTTKADSGKWRGELRDDLEREVYEIRERMEVAFDRTRETFKRELKTDEAVHDPNALIRRVSEGMVDAVNQASGELAEAADRIGATFRESTSTEVVVPAVTTGELVRVVDTPQVVVRPRATGFKKFRATWGGGMAGTGSGGAVGLLVGMAIPVIGPFVGWAVGALIGRIAGLFGGARQARRDEEERMRREHVADLRDQVLPLIESARRRAERHLNQQAKEYGRTLVAALDEQIAAQVASLTESARRLEAIRNSTVQQRAERLPVLTLVEKRYAVARERLADLRERVTRLHEFNRFGVAGQDKP